MSNGVTRWLEELGLGKYAAVFAENDIDTELLLQLTDDDLKELGVASLGHRKKMLNSIGILRSEGVRVATSDLESISVSIDKAEAERRQLTVMFCDLVGSTALAERLDPEELRELIRAYQDAATAAIERFEGYVARYVGDGILAYFGYPQAHEDDAERAVHAGLGIVDVLDDLNSGLARGKGVELAVRIGIATGLVVVGDLIGEGASQESTVVGETPNLAARLQALAEANGVVIAESTYRLAGGRFEYVDLGTQVLKGVAKPVQAWRVMGERQAESRFEALHKAGLTPLVGREHEIALLLERWEQVKEGEGQVVLLSGEAGIGKSRIAQTIREHTALEEPIRLRYQCSPYHTSSALHPIIAQLEQAAQFEGGDSPQSKLEKLESLLALSTKSVEAVAPLFATLLSVPAEDRYVPLKMTPEQQKGKTLEALVAQLHGLCQQQLVLLIFEDVHWADPTSLELLEMMVEQAQRSRVLAIITFRPEFTSPWTGYAHITSLTLNRFSRKLAAALVEKITGGKSLPDEVHEEIIAKTDGVPLFVEELTKTILESGLLKEEPERYALSGPLSTVAIPATLHDSLMARLDRLGDVKEVAQYASAIGREFPRDLLAAVSPLKDDELQDALDQLVDAELVFRRGTPPEANYLFKHALVQDAAYESLLKSKRQQLHDRIAKVLETQFPERAESEPELLAYHFTEAGLSEPAIAYWKKAGLRAIERSTNLEAVAHLTKGLELLGQLPNSVERAQEELSLQAPLVSALTGAKGYSAPETGKAVMRARDLCREIGDTPQTFEVLYGVWGYVYVGGDHHAAGKLAEEGLSLAQEGGAHARLVAAHSMLGQTLVSLGRFDAAQDHLEKSIALYEPEADRTLCLIYGEDPAIASLNWLTWVLWFRGFPEQALARSHEALDKAQQLSHANTTGFALAYAAVLRHFCRDRKAAREKAQAAVDFSTEQNVPVFEAYGTVMRGWSLVEDGHPEEGVAQMHRGVAEWKAAGAVIMLPFFFALLAQGYERCGNLEEGLKLLNDAFDQVKRSGEYMWEPELHRLRATLLLSVSLKNAPEAETCFRKAMDVAQQQSAKSLELRAATSLGRLWHDQSKGEEARNLLAPIYNWFSEGFETAELKDAKALLEQLL